MKGKLDKRTVACLIGFFVGAAIMFYPAISNAWNEHLFKTVVTSYRTDVAAGGMDIEAELEAARAYNTALEPRRVPDAFTAKEQQIDEEYDDLLNVTGDGVMAYISIPVIDVELPIYHYTNEETLKKGVGHLPGSSLPVGGENTHTVLSAHRGLPSAKLFTDLNLLECGDAFYIHVLDQTLKYEVDQILTVLPEDTESLAASEKNDYVTLVTCTPYGVNTHRLLVRGHRVEYDEHGGDAEDSAESRNDYKRLTTTLLCGAAGLALALLIVAAADARRKKRENRNNEKENLS